MGTVTAQQAVGGMGLVVVGVVAVIGLATVPGGPHEAAGGRSAGAVSAAPLEVSSFVSLLPTMAAIADAPAVRAHDVVAGDTLSGIARTYGTTVDALVDRNGIDAADPLQVGQVLLIP